MFVSRKGSFLEEEFLSKELSGRMVELDEVIEPSLQPKSRRAQEIVRVAPTLVEVEADDGDHKGLDQVTTTPRRSTRSHTTTEWYGNPVLEVMLLSNGEPMSYGESDGGPGFRQKAGSHEIRERIHV